MEVTFCKDLTYGFDQYPIALVNDSKEELNSFEGKNIGSKIASSIEAACIKVKEIMGLLPETYMIDHIIGEHHGQCNLFDDYTHIYDSYILGYGNKEAAILFEHYQINPDYVEFAEFTGESSRFERYLSLKAVDWIELNIHKITKENIEMLRGFCEAIQTMTNKKILIYDKEEFCDLKFFCARLYEA